MDYARTVKRLGNHEDLTKVDLHDILPSATVMVVNMTRTKSYGRDLTEAEWKACDEACDLAFGLDKAKATVSCFFVDYSLSENICDLIISLICLVTTYQVNGVLTNVVLYFFVSTLTIIDQRICGVEVDVYCTQLVGDHWNDNGSKTDGTSRRSDSIEQDACLQHSSPGKRQGPQLCTVLSIASQERRLHLLLALCSYATLGYP